MVKVDPLTALNHVFAGWLYVAAGKPEEALQHYRRGYDLDPVGPLMNFTWGFALMRVGRSAEAAEHYRQFANQAGSSVFGELAAGFSHALTGDADAARRAIGSMTTAAGRADEAIARFLALLANIRPRWAAFEV